MAKGIPVCWRYAADRYCFLLFKSHIYRSIRIPFIKGTYSRCCHGLRRQEYKALLSYEGKTDEEIFFTDYKEYNIGGKKVSVGNANAYDEETAKDLVARMRAVMPAARDKAGMDMSFAMVSILHDDLSVTWLVPSDEAAKEVLRAAFGDRAVPDGEAWKIEPYASRKAVFIPAITTLLEAAAKE